MQENFPAAVSEVLKHEGGYVDHPRDPGGATNLGITLATLRAWRGRPVGKAEVRALTAAEAGAIYRANYWDRVQGDALPAGVDLALFDFAVNSGPARASMFVQEIVGVAADGRIGPISLAAIQRFAADRGAAALVTQLCARRLDFLRRLSTWASFGRGWARRVADVQAESLDLAVQMATKAPPRRPDDAGGDAATGGGIIGVLIRLLAGVVSTLLRRKS